MRWHHVRQVDFNLHLPPDILSGYLRNLVVIQFDQINLRSTSHHTCSFEQLSQWCDQNCEGVYSALPNSHNQVQFRFNLDTDRAAFCEYLAQSVASDQSDPT
jgi:hypothetical protein